MLEDKNLMKNLKKYRDKLAKALDLNSRLTSRLMTEKSRSNIISNTQRSILTKEDHSNTESMNVISTIKSPSVKQDRKAKGVMK